MAFGDTYGYKTTNRFVAAVATSDEEGVTGEEVVDLVLLGFANGQRKSVPVAADQASAENNQAVAAAGVTQVPVVFEDGVRV